MAKADQNLSFYIIILVTCFNLFNIGQIECFNVYNTNFDKIHEYNPEQRLQERNNMKFQDGFPISSIVVQPAQQSSEQLKRVTKIRDSFNINVNLMLNILLYEMSFQEEDQDPSDINFKISKPTYCYVFGVCSNLFCNCD